jgi:hypothetical protein
MPSGPGLAIRTCTTRSLAQTLPGYASGSPGRMIWLSTALGSGAGVGCCGITMVADHSESMWGPRGFGTNGSVRAVTLPADQPNNRREATDTGRSAYTDGFELVWGLFPVEWLFSVYCQFFVRRCVQVRRAHRGICAIPDTIFGSHRWHCEGVPLSRSRVEGDLSPRRTWKTWTSRFSAIPSSADGGSRALWIFCEARSRFSHRGGLEKARADTVTAVQLNGGQR